MSDPRAAWRVVEAFEAALSEYTGAKYVIAVDSCTNALYLCFVRLVQQGHETISLPRRTYVGVARAAINAGLKIRWIDQEWVGEYEIMHGFSLGVIDAARWLRRGMYQADTWTCLSFHATKHLPIGRGGAILCDNPETQEWFRRARYDGRDQTRPIMEQREFVWGAHVYMPPEAAARGLLLMTGLKDENDPLPGTYPDLSKVTFLP